MGKGCRGAGVGVRVGRDVMVGERGRRRREGCGKVVMKGSRKGREVVQGY